MILRENRVAHPPHRLYSLITNTKSQLKLQKKSNDLKAEFLSSGQHSRQFLEKYSVSGKKEI